MKLGTGLAFAALALVLSLAVPAAAHDSIRFQASPGFTPSFPLKDLKAGIDATPLGGGLDFLWRLGGSPILYGFSANLQGYGWTTRRELLSPDIPEVQVKVGTSNLVFLGHALVRLQPAAGRIRPYAEGLAGLTALWTETSAFDRDGAAIASTVNQHDEAFSFGAGAGVMSDLYRRGSFGILFDAGARVLFGGRAQYLRKGDLGRMTFADARRISRTDLVMAHVGLAFEFDVRLRRAAD